ncbi:hypothetical protein D3P09_12485 [Paenibacillus pinisoli]|uniref:Uncharacterized protein n=1 Tax=Paenibacillus pinisoli TaxID=1276110 RepID=A0A3A6PEQ4_9BACL|nr:hypothetical protein [Paenibacillus pinisoli]RJX40172.1 hypothetical protein D3P09_12485 [Paenibacillus pinisoli]
MNRPLQSLPVVIVWKTILSAFLFTVIGLAYASGHADAAPSSAELHVRSSPDAQHESVKPLPPALLDGLMSIGNGPQPASDLYLTVRQTAGNSIMIYTLDALGNLHREDGQVFLLRPAARSKLLHEARQLRSQHYGELLPWQEAKSVIPRKANLTVVDLETGLRFNAQRRAGSSHADVQPLTKVDSETMKEIYGGKWSWHRRAILVIANGRTLAASMHGMPHGGDGIPDNGFRGHFCIHFQGSATHGKGNIDLGHQLMVAKASGTLERFIGALDPYDAVNAFFLANEYGDRALMRAVFADSLSPQANSRHFGAEEAAIRHQFIESEDIPGTALTAAIRVETCQARGGKCVNKTMSLFHLGRLSPMDAWKIDEITRSKQ